MTALNRIEAITTEDHIAKRNILEINETMERLGLLAIKWIHLVKKKEGSNL